MAKRIEFTPGIEAMRGSFSPKQKLQYALHNNPAFEAPVGRQYARNYQANFVGAKRSATGLKYFFTKTKSATLVTSESKLRMAITGAAGAIFADIQRNATTANSIYYRLQYAWKEYYKSPKTFRAWCMEHLKSMLSIKSAATNMGHDAQGDIVYVHNPWYIRQRPQTAYVPQIAEETLVKFWLQLAADDNGDTASIFTVDGRKGIAFAGITFDSNTFADINILNLQALEVGTPAEEHQVMGIVDGTVNYYLQINGGYVDADAAVVANGRYVTTQVAPE